MIALVAAPIAWFLFGDWALDIAEHTLDGTRAVSRAWQAQSPPRLGTGDYSKPRWAPVASWERQTAIALLSQQTTLVVSTALGTQLAGQALPLRPGEIPVLVRAVRWKENLDVWLEPNRLEVRTWGYDCFAPNPEPAPYPIIVSLAAPPATLDLRANIECF